MDTTQTITHLSLCSGYGGIGLGLKRVLPSLRDIAHVEIEAFAVANLVAKMEAGQLDACPIWTNLKTFPFADFHGKVDILTGGYPCQPFSVAGQRKGKNDPRHLFPYIAKGIRAARPTLCFFENVEGHLSEGFREVQQSLRRLGYRVEAGIFSASEIGAPHQRKRLFILGVENSVCLRGRGWDRLQLRPSEITQNQTKGSSGEKLGDSQHNGLPTQPILRGDEKPSNQRRKKESRETRESQGASRPSHVPSISGSQEGGELPHPHSEGRHRNEQPSGQREEQPRASILHTRTQFPARPNEPQHEWEEPRTKSKMGRAVNGTSSRVDELRLLGNGVVPDTAELAFRTIIQKFQ